MLFNSFFPAAELHKEFEYTKLSVVETLFYLCYEKFQRSILCAVIQSNAIFFFGKWWKDYLWQKYAPSHWNNIYSACLLYIYLYNKKSNTREKSWRRFLEGLTSLECWNEWSINFFRIECHRNMSAQERWLMYSII